LAVFAAFAALVVALAALVVALAWVRGDAVERFLGRRGRAAID
jgi:hypothetical protein